jgi:hypothetical protein
MISFPSYLRHDARCLNSCHLAGVSTEHGSVVVSKHLTLQAAVNSDGQKQTEALLTAVRLIGLTLAWPMEKGNGEPCTLARRSVTNGSLSSLRFESSCRTTNKGFRAIKLTMNDGTMQFALSA